MDCVIEALIEIFGECFCTICIEAFPSVGSSSPAKKVARVLLYIFGSLTILAIPICGAAGIVCLTKNKYTYAAILLSVAGGLLSITIGVFVAAHVRKKKKIKTMCETVETDGNSYRECVQCDKNGYSVKPPLPDTESASAAQENTENE